MRWLSLSGGRDRDDGRLRSHRNSVLHLLKAVRDDALARPDTLVDDPEPLHLLSDFDRAERDPVVRKDDGDLVDALRLLDRARWHEHGAANCDARSADFRVETRAEETVGVREERLYLDGPRLLIDLPVRDVEIPRERIGAFVGQDQLEIRVVPGR